MIFLPGKSTKSSKLIKGYGQPFSRSQARMDQGAGYMKRANSHFPVRPEVVNLSFSPTLEINEYVRASRAKGLALLHLGFGESPFPVHPILQNALTENADKSMYLPASGLPELRQKAGAYFVNHFGIDWEEYEVVIGPGSKALIYALQLAVEGDLLLPVPSWVSYGPQSGLAGDTVIKIPMTLTENYSINAARLENAILESRRNGQNPKKLVLNYPNNPTGLSIPPPQLAEIAEVCRRFGVLVISDEIYGLVHHRQEHLSIAGAYPEGTVVTSGLSKHLSLGGYRVGVALIPAVLKSVYQAALRVASETWSTVAAPIQYAVVKAFENDPEIEGYIRDCTLIHGLVSGYLRQVLVDLGCEYPPLDGGFYLFPDFKRFRERLQARDIHSSDDLAHALMEEVQIVTLPGTAFGDVPESLTLRLASCDYHGGEALEYFQSHRECFPESLVRACCPNIKLAGERLGDFFSGVELAK
jgi:aspartate/methionine/tyrosine aminotransferase